MLKRMELIELITMEAHRDISLLLKWTKKRLRRIEEYFLDQKEIFTNLGRQTNGYHNTKRRKD
jgi:hypothetical protein